MTELNPELGTIEIADGYYQATLVRVLDHDRESVWAMLTEPGQFINWLAPGEIELKKGGVARLNFTDSGIVIDSIVSEYEAPGLLQYSWSSGDEPQRPVRWQLDTLATGTQLTLGLAIPQGEDVARSCAGWEAYNKLIGA